MAADKNIRFRKINFFTGILLTSNNFNDIMHYADKKYPVQKYSFLRKAKKIYLSKWTGIVDFTRFAEYFRFFAPAVRTDSYFGVGLLRMRFANSVLLETPAFEYILPAWYFTVRSATNNSSAIAL